VLVPTDDDPPSPRQLIDVERRVHRILRARFAEALVELAVSFAQLEVMELLHDREKLHPGAIGRLLLITRQSADHLVRQLERRDLVDVWDNEGGTLGVSLTDRGHRRIRHCYAALGPTFERLASIDGATRTRLLTDLMSCEDALRPRYVPWRL
jgi:DNA-binding MarR family transcriptional regulator